MARKPEEIIIESCPMNGGSDTYSYSQHSIYQRSVLDSAKKLIQESIKTQLDISSLFLTSTTNPSFHIADFGCSVGPNTFISVHNILEAVRLKTQESKTNIEGDIEFQVFFCDQTNNDFNTLFRSLPTHQNYYAAGVPGSFHGRLFPEASLHFGCISSSLHWLSRAPVEITKRSSGTIQCTGFDGEVSKAYSAQFSRDMDAFFDARAREIVSGGLMAISTICLPDGEGACWSQTGIGMIIDLLGSCLVDMANKGLISQDKLESFYLPVYHCKVEELESLISRNGCFSIQKIERMPPSLPWNSPEIIQLMLPSLRAGFEILITQHFRITSPSTVDLLFDHLAEKFSQNMSAITSIPTTLQHLEAFILAKRV